MQYAIIMCIQLLISRVYKHYIMLVSYIVSHDHETSVYTRTPKRIGEHYNILDICIALSGVCVCVCVLGGGYD